MDPRNTHEKKSWTHKIPTRKNFRPTKYTQEKTWDSQNTHDKKGVDQRNTHEKIFWTHEISTIKKNCTHEIPTKTRWHGGTRPTRPTIARIQRNLGHPCKLYFFE